MTDFEKQTKEQWTKSLDVNLTSVFFLIQSISPLLAKAKNPSIINISSIYGSHAPDYDIYKNTGLNNPAGYSISKPHPKMNAPSTNFVRTYQMEDYMYRRFDLQLSERLMSH